MASTATKGIAIKLAKTLAIVASAALLALGALAAKNIDKIQNAAIAYKETGDLAAAWQVFSREKAPIRELLSELAPLPCDLNAQPCKISDKSGANTYEIELSPRPIEALSEHVLHIRGGSLKRPIIKATGLNMYMGMLVDDFARANANASSTAGDEWMADVVFSPCTEDVMRYRLELFDGAQSTGAWVDLDVRR